MITRIRYTLYTPDLFHGVSDEEYKSYDILDSMIKYQELVEAEIGKAYPIAEVDVIKSLDPISEYQEVWVDSDLKDPYQNFLEVVDCTDQIREIAGEVFSGFEWLVEAENS